MGDSKSALVMEPGATDVEGWQDCAGGAITGSRNRKAGQGGRGARQPETVGVVPFLAACEMAHLLVCYLGRRCASAATSSSSSQQCERPGGVAVAPALGVAWHGHVRRPSKAGCHVSWRHPRACWLLHHVRRRRSVPRFLRRTTRVRSCASHHKAGSDPHAPLACPSSGEARERLRALGGAGSELDAGCSQALRRRRGGGAARVVLRRFASLPHITARPKSGWLV